MTSHRVPVSHPDRAVRLAVLTKEAAGNLELEKVDGEVVLSGRVPAAPEIERLLEASWLPGSDRWGPLEAVVAIVPNIGIVFPYREQAAPIDPNHDQERLEMARSKDPASFLPLAATEYAVLLALADGEKHAYAILREVSWLSDSPGKGSGLKVSASTLYSVVQRLERKALIRESVERPDPALDDQRRRYFELTDLGLAVARAETTRLESMVSLARSGRLEEKKA